LKQTVAEDGSSEFILATHCFKAILLRYRDAELHEAIAAFIRGVQNSVAPPIHTLPDGDLLGLEEWMGDTDGKESKWRISNANHDFSVPNNLNNIPVYV
jgi:hypothetical protein